MLYFDQFPQLYYTFDRDQQEFYQLTNIFTRINVLSAVLQNSLVYYKYPVKDGDTLETIAYKMYGDPLRHWIIVLANMIIDPYFNMPLNQVDFANNVIAAYGSVANAQSTLDHIEQTQTVITTINGISNTSTYNATVTLEPYTYDFATNTLVAQAIPTLDQPLLTVSDVTVVTPDGSTVETITQLQAVSVYDNLFNMNEAKREIILIDPSYIPQIEQQFQSLIQQ